MTKSVLRNIILFFLPILLASILWSQPAPQQSPVPALPADIPSTAERYSVLLTGNLAGQQAVWTASDGTLHIFFQFNDRGRGPKTTSILKVDANGVPVSEVITGNDYLKSPVTENYSLEQGTARWKNESQTNCSLRLTTGSLSFRKGGKLPSRLCSPRKARSKSRDPP